MQPRHGAFLALSLCAAGCTLLFQTNDPLQCHVDADCDAVQQLAGRICSSGFCVPKGPPPTPVADAGQGCVSTDLCTQANTNKASVCEQRGGPCTVWQIDACPFIDGAWKDPDVLMLGAVLPLTVKQFDGSLAPVPYVKRLYRALALGLQDFSTAYPRGLRGIDGKNRPLGLLTCDSSADPPTARAVFDHLTRVVHAPAVLVLSDDDLGEIAVDATNRQTTIVCTDCITELPHDALAWRTVPPIALEAPMAARRVADVEAQLRGGGQTSIKVAVLEDPNRGAAAFAGAFSKIVKFNGDKSASDNEADGNYREWIGDDGRLHPIQPDKTAQEIRDFGPDIVVAAMGPDLPIYYIPLIESLWPTSKARPHYLVTEMSRDSIPNWRDLFANAATAGVLPRVDGTRPYLTPELKTNLDAFSRHYRTESNGQEPDGNESGYDAIYALMYAVAASMQQPKLDGPSISTGFERLVPDPSVDAASAPTIDVGPGSLQAAVGLLGLGNTIDLRGTASLLDWDLLTRDLRPETVDGGGWCFHKNADGTIVVYDDTGLRYDARTGTFVGSFDPAGNCK